MSRSNFWLRGFGLAAMAGLALLLLAPTSGLHVSQVEGAVEIGSGEPPAWRPAHDGDVLEPGDAVRTGAGARAELVLGTRTARLYENSVLRIPDDAMGNRGPREVSLERGRSIFDVLKDGRGDRFDVRTPEVVVSVKGTVFLVDAGEEGASSVSVFRGQVGVRALTQAMTSEVMVRPGFTAFGGVALPLELRLNEIQNPWDAFPRGGPPPTPSAAARTRPVVEQARDAARRATAAGIARQEQKLEAQPGAERLKQARGLPAKRDGVDAIDTNEPAAGGGGPVSFPAKRAEQLEKVTDVMRQQHKQGQMQGALGAAIQPPHETVAASVGTPFLGDGSFSYVIDDGDLLLFRQGQSYTVVDEARIEDFLDNSGSGGSSPNKLGAPMMHFMQQQNVAPRDVRSFLSDHFDK